MMPLPPSMRAEAHLPLGAPERLKPVPAAPPAVLRAPVAGDA